MTVKSVFKYSLTGLLLFGGLCAGLSGCSGFTEKQETINEYVNETETVKDTVNETAKEHDLDLDIDFYEVTYYGGGSSPFGKKVYVKCDNISSNKADTVALQTLKKIENTKNIDGDVKAILSESLNNLPVSPFVADKIAEAGL